jgi:hypothetical protein
MSSFKEKLIATLKKDLLEVKELENPKLIRKEISLISKRIVSAKKLLSDDVQALNELTSLEKEL